MTFSMFEKQPWSSQNMNDLLSLNIYWALINTPINDPFPRSIENVCDDSTDYSNIAAYSYVSSLSRK